MTTASDWLTPADVARILDTSEDMLKKWRYQERGPIYFKIGRSVRYRRIHVERWIRARAHGIEPARTVARTLTERPTR